MEPAFFQQLQTAYPRLAAKARLQIDKVSGEPVLLYPEGVVLLNGPSAAITRLCDGTRSFPEILAQLAEQYNTTASELAEDVGGYIFNLHQQSLLELAVDQEPKQ
jgi:pyrroloquinoline quinone biosynthesis protein D